MEVTPVNWTILTINSLRNSEFGMYKRCMVLSFIKTFDGIANANLLTMKDLCNHIIVFPLPVGI